MFEKKAPLQTPPKDDLGVFKPSKGTKKVIIGNGVDAYSGPFYGNKTILFRINEGSIADVSNTQNDWTEIILIDGKKGWVPNESIRMLR